MRLREYNSARSIYLGCLSLFFFAMLLTVFSAKNRWAAQLGYKFVSSLVEPMEAVVHYSSSGVEDLWSTYVALLDVREQNHALLRENMGLQRENLRLQELAYENSRLRELWKLKVEHELHGVIADVIGVDSQFSNQAVTISKGTEEGVREGMAVIAQNGVFGRVIVAASNRAKVLLITDPTSGVDVYLQSTRALGIIEGTGHFGFKLNYVRSDGEVVVGDRVLTTGLDEVFPKGLMVGTVSKVAVNESGSLFYSVHVEPAVDFDHVETVLVVDKNLLD